MGSSAPSTPTETEAATNTEPLTMADKIKAEQEANPLCHEWIVAAEIQIDTKTARRASFRGSFRTQEGMRVDALETYCRKCRRPLDEVGDRDCPAKINNEHLIGGDPGVRAKRKVPEAPGRMVQVPLIERRRMQMGGYSVHAGR